MKMSCLVCVFVLLIAFPAQSADWAQWRGPSRNGIAAESPSLADKWAADGPKKLWESEEPIPGGGAGGYGSPVVADGRVFMFVCWKYREPLETRTLATKALEQLGWIAEKPPEDLLKAIEAARVSDERAALKGRDAQEWVRKWVAEKLDADQQKKFGRFVTQRLNEAKDAIPLDVLDKLATIKDKPLANHAALDQWFADNGIGGPLKDRIAKSFPVDEEKAHDTIVCLDAATGKTLWKKQYPGVPHQHGSSSTPCIADGRCYVAGSDGGIYCLDAKTGDEVWKAQVGKGDKNSSFVVVDGVAIIAAGPLTGFDAATGKVLWSQKAVGPTNSSPAYWEKDGKTYLLVGGSCIDPKTGDVLWKSPGPGNSTPAIVGDHMVVLTGDGKIGVIAYKLAKDKAEKLWSVETFADRGASPLVHDGHVYAMGSQGAVCVHLESGKVVWDGKPGTDEFSSPLLADGKLFVGGRGGLVLMLKASPEKCDVLGKAKVGMVACTSAAFADGKLFVRLAKSIACYDLTAKAN